MEMAFLGAQTAYFIMNMRPYGSLVLPGHVFAVSGYFQGILEYFQDFGYLFYLGNPKSLTMTNHD